MRACATSSLRAIRSRASPALQSSGSVSTRGSTQAPTVFDGIAQEQLERDHPLRAERAEHGLARVRAEMPQHGGGLLAAEPLEQQRAVRGAAAARRSVPR